MIRALTGADLSAYRALWLDGLRRTPDAFLLTEAEALGMSDAQLIARLEKGTIFGALEQDQLVGMIALSRGGPERLRHMGDLGPLYVHPSAQGRGLGRALMQVAEEAARDLGLLQVELCVDATNHGAIGLYKSCGFVQIGLRPRSVIVNGTPRDDLLMLKQLDHA
ncbi:GNAT family N-acetyltransferase [Tropicibacter sp. R15_0]|uniref:GNAT family N-acetyltransferase n=1 Tax=Tropicibacter sp. R15_0 TaxID=2821101 RepID=UPI001ADB90DE|nr:GNAT family N-acetyltransferase [Tropicibacter sp. R15_0]MBO9465168.1 GNAT family N-acetyltransferase [Tropicibacter sp. R15_0]